MAGWRLKGAVFDLEEMLRLIRPADESSGEASADWVCGPSPHLCHTCPVHGDQM